MTDTTPRQFVAGDTVSWDWSSAEYPRSDGYDARYVFTTPGRQFVVPGVDNGSDGWTFTISAAQSAQWPAAGYGWQRYVTIGSDRYTTGQGRTNVIVDLDPATSGLDTRSLYQKIIEQIDETIHARVTGDVTQYSIGGRQLIKMSTADLWTLRKQYQGLLDQYLQATGQGGRSRVIRTVI